jgi:hypothetical protein
MILLITSIDVYTKYLLRPDLETLEKEGRINLEELGLTQSVKEQEGVGNLFVTALKHVSASLRKETQEDKPLSQTDSADR